MKTLFQLDVDPAFEDQLRGMLRRRAADVRPSPPEWRDLVEQTGAVVVSLHTRLPVEQTPARRSAWRPWMRPLLAAAAALAVVMGAATVVGGGGGGGSGNGDSDDEGTALANSEDAVEIIAPGSFEFDATTAAPLYPLDADFVVAGGADGLGEVEADLAEEIAGAEEEIAGTEDGEAILGDEIGQLDRFAGVDQTDPDAVALQFLQSVGVADPPDGLEFWVDPAVEELRQGPDQTQVEIATVWWSVRREDWGERLAEGPVFLRNDAAPAEPPSWLTVGASTMNLRLVDVLTDGATVEFTVSRIADDREETVIAGLQDPLIGEIMPLDEVEPGDRSTYDVAVSSEPMIVMTQHLIDGQPVSVTAVAIRLSDLPFTVPSPWVTDLPTTTVTTPPSTAG